MPWGVILAWGIVAAGLCFFFRVASEPAPEPAPAPKQPYAGCTPSCMPLVYGGTTKCRVCGITWDTDDDFPPSCPHPNATWPVKEHVQ